MKKLITFLALILVISCSDDKATTEPEPDIDTTAYCHDIDDMPSGLEGTYVRIIAVLPNPDGDDDYNEKFRVRSFIEQEIYLDGYYIKDDEGVRWDISELEKELIFNLECRYYNYKSDKVAQLLNSGDTIYLYSPDDVLIQTVNYGVTKDGEWVDVMGDL